MPVPDPHERKIVDACGCSGAHSAFPLAVSLHDVCPVYDAAQCAVVPSA